MTTQLSSPTLKSSDATQVSQGKKGRCFSGARPTRRQHLGNYLGAIQNYVLLQNDYDCLYFNTDVLADGKERAKTLAEKTMQEVRAAVGLP